MTPVLSNSHLYIILQQRKALTSSNKPCIDKLRREWREGIDSFVIDEGKVQLIAYFHQTLSEVFVDDVFEQISPTRAIHCQPVSNCKHSPMSQRTVIVTPTNTTRRRSA